MAHAYAVPPHVSDQPSHSHVRHSDIPPKRQLQDGYAWRDVLCLAWHASSLASPPWRRHCLTSCLFFQVTVPCHPPPTVGMLGMAIRAGHSPRGPYITAPLSTVIPPADRFFLPSLAPLFPVQSHPHNHNQCLAAAVFLCNSLTCHSVYLCSPVCPIGELCLDILKTDWSPAWSLQAVCHAVIALLHDPNPDSPLNCDAGEMLGWDGMRRLGWGRELQSHLCVLPLCRQLASFWRRARVQVNGTDVHTRAGRRVGESMGAESGLP